MNCKPGDLAILVSAFAEHKDCIGRIVIVREAYQEDKWKITFVGANPISTLRKLSIFGFIASKDKNLKPVSGLPMEEETQETIKEKA